MLYSRRLIPGKETITVPEARLGFLVTEIQQTILYLN